MTTPLAELPFTVSCPACRSAPGDRCTTRMVRGYHLARADKAVRTENRRTRGTNQKVGNTK